MSDAVPGYGTILKIGDGGGPEVFTAIAEIKDTEGPGFEMGTTEVTHHASPGAFREWAAGLLDAGEVTFECNFLPGNATQDNVTGVLSKMLSRTKTNFQLIWPTVPPEQVDFEALVTGFEPSAPIEDALSADVTLKVTKQPTFV